MGHSRQVIALAGVGNLGRYVCEELSASPEFEVIVLTRGVSLPSIMRERPQIPSKDFDPRIGTPY